MTNVARVLLSRGHGAHLLVDGSTLALDTQQVPRLANGPTQAGRWWEPVPVVPKVPIMGDLAMLAEPVPEMEKIRYLAGQGWSRNQIAGELGGRTTDALERIGAVLG